MLRTAVRGIRGGLTSEFLDAHINSHGAAMTGGVGEEDRSQHYPGRSRESSSNQAQGTHDGFDGVHVVGVQVDGADNGLYGSRHGDGGNGAPAACEIDESTEVVRESNRVQVVVGSNALTDTVIRC